MRDEIKKFYKSYSGFFLLSYDPFVFLKKKFTNSFD